MNKEVSCLVDYELIPLEQDYIPYKKGNRWADPNVEQAALYMRQISENTELADTLAELAYVFVTDTLSIDGIKDKIEKRLLDINYV